MHSSRNDALRDDESFLDWFFRSRVTGKVVVVQTPNAALWIAIVTAGLAWMWPSAGAASMAVSIMCRSALLIWAADEMLRQSLASLPRSKRRRLSARVDVLGALLKLLYPQSTGVSSENGGDQFPPADEAVFERGDRGTLFH